MTQFCKGQQIAYVPLHAQHEGSNGFIWNPKHPDVEFGFVVSQRENTVFCRYWRKGQPGTLRTIANSEGTSADCLVPYKSVLAGDVWGCLQELGIDKAVKE